MKNTTFKLVAVAALPLSPVRLRRGFHAHRTVRRRYRPFVRRYRVDGTDISGVYYNPASMTLTRAPPPSWASSAWV